MKEREKGKKNEPSRTSKHQMSSSSSSRSSIFFRHHLGIHLGPYSITLMQQKLESGSNGS